MIAQGPNIRLTAFSLAILWAPIPIEGDEGGPLLEEVFQSELVYPQEQGEVQVTLVPRFGSAADGETLRSGVTVEYGLTDTWQLEFEWDFFVRNESDGQTAEGLGDIEIGFKWARLELAEHTQAWFGSYLVSGRSVVVFRSESVATPTTMA